ncbi:hypothetical protein MaudMau93_005709 [Microsporum audouinii]
MLNFIPLFAFICFALSEGGVGNHLAHKTPTITTPSMATASVLLIPLEVSLPHTISRPVTHTVEVLPSTPAFLPGTVEAGIGDMILFRSYGRNPSVVESELSPLCMPKEAGNLYENPYLVTDAMPHLFYHNDGISTTLCGFKSMFKLNFHFNGTYPSQSKYHYGLTETAASGTGFPWPLQSGYHYGLTGTAASGTGFPMQPFQSGVNATGGQRGATHRPTAPLSSPTFASTAAFLYHGNLFLMLLNMLSLFIRIEMI